jgi:hypothetical protein
VFARNIHLHLSEPFAKGWRWFASLDAYAPPRRIRMLKRGLVHRITRQLACWVLFLAVSAAASAQTGTLVAPSMETIVARMALARVENQASFRPYIVTRDYKLFGKERLTSKSQVIADVSFVPPDHKKYTIQQANGFGLGERIVRRMLDSETEITSGNSSTDISLDNYDFRFLREEAVDNQPCYVLGMLPRRKDKNLLRGNIWVDVRTYLLRRTEGEPAKALSWWVRDLRIAFLYGDVHGMWLQTAMEATANVRMLGRYTMEARDVTYEISELVAARAAAAISAAKIPTSSSPIK